MKPEIRSFKFETKNINTDDEDFILIEGHAAIFNSPSDSGGLAWFTEEIMPGAFKDAIKEDDIRALFNHDSNYVMGRNTAGTLELKEDKTGLAVKIKAPKTQWMLDRAISMKRGDINQMSFAFVPRATGDDIGEEWIFTDDDEVKRNIFNVKLFDVSVVTFPWYEDAEASVRTQKIFQDAKDGEEARKTKEQEGKNRIEQEGNKIKISQAQRARQLILNKRR